MIAAPLQTPQRISTAGFTLLEVLVALAVMGLLLLSLIEGNHFILSGWDRQTRLAGRTEDLDAVDRTLRRLVAQAKPSSKWEQLIFAGTARTATFTSVMPLPAAGFPTQRADVELVVDAAHRLVVRWRPHVHAINVGRPAPTVTDEVLAGVDRLELSYLPAGQGAGWTSTWQNEGPPALVRIRIVFSDPGHGRWPDIVVAPMLDPT